VLDAFSRRVVGRALDTHLVARLAVAPLSMALAARQPRPGSLIHHSDRGIQYACGDCTELPQQHDIAPSMSRVGNPYDNAKAESLMKTLKQEEVNGQTCRDAQYAKMRSALSSRSCTMVNGYARRWPTGPLPSSKQI
jgi:putative transposase